MRTISAVGGTPCERASASTIALFATTRGTFYQPKGEQNPLLIGLAHQIHLEPTPFRLTAAGRPRPTLCSAAVRETPARLFRPPVIARSVAHGTGQTRGRPAGASIRRRIGTFGACELTA